MAESLGHTKAHIPVYVQNVETVLSNWKMVNFSYEDYYSIMFNISKEYRLKHDEFDAFFKDFGRKQFEYLDPQTPFIVCTLTNYEKDDKEYKKKLSKQEQEYVLTETGDFLIVLRNGLTRELYQLARRCKYRQRRLKRKIAEQQQEQEPPLKKTVSYYFASTPSAYAKDMILFQDSNYFAMIYKSKGCLTLKGLLRKGYHTRMQENFNMLEQRYMKIFVALKNGVTTYSIQQKLSTLLTRNTSGPCSEFLKKCLVTMTKVYDVTMDYTVDGVINERNTHKGKLRKVFINMGFDGKFIELVKEVVNVVDEPSKSTTTTSS